MSEPAIVHDVDAPTLMDVDGPIPAFPPRQRDADGSVMPITEEEAHSRADAFRRAMAAIPPDESDEGNWWLEGMKDIDAMRGSGRKLFEEFYAHGASRGA